MIRPASNNPFIGIACGGTGGHLFPGMAVGEELLERGCSVALLISPKEVDQQAAASAVGMEVVTLPAVGLTRTGLIQFFVGFWKAYRLAKALFQKRSPQAVLAMGGFTSAPPVLAGRKLGAATFLHESNAIPGRANRWLAHVVDEAFIGFSETATRLAQDHVTVTGTPVRRQFKAQAAASCRLALGLDAQRSVVLVMGGSQGAAGINDLVLRTLPTLAVMAPDLQFLHLTGVNDFEKVRAAYQRSRLKAVVRPFLTEMELALGAASAAISRAGASSLAELAAMGVPAILIPYPAAVGNHQFYNAQTFVSAGAARMVEQDKATPENLNWLILELTGNRVTRAAVIEALTRCHFPQAAETIATRVLALLRDQTRDLEGALPIPSGERDRRASSTRDVVIR